MNHVKKIFISSLILLIILICIISGIIFGVINGHLDKQVTSLLEYSFEQRGVKAKFAGLSIKNKKLFIKSSLLELKNQSKIKIHDLSINFDFDLSKNIRKKLPVLIDINSDKAVFYSKNDQELVKFKIFGQNQFDIIRNKLVLDLTCVSDDATKNDKAKILYKTRILQNSTKTLNVETTIGESTIKLDIFQRGNIVTSEALFIQVPILAYKIFQHILPDHDIFFFMDHYTENGFIDGSFNVKLDISHLNSHVARDDIINGNFRIRDLKLTYDKDFPAISNIDSSLTIHGSNVRFDVHKAYSNKTLISDAIVTMDWQGVDKTTIIIDGVAKGPTTDFIDFVDYKIYQNLKAQDIDLRKFSSNADTKIAIKIPLKPKVPAIFDISTSIENAGIKIFAGQVLLKDAKLQGMFNGSKVIINGSGLINDYPSKINYEFNITNNPKDDFIDILKIESSVVAKKQVINILTFLSGSATVDFQYKGLKNGQNLITAKSKLDDLEFYIDKISIHKPIKKKAQLSLEYFVNQKSGNKIALSLVGEDQLKIVGSVIIKADKYILDFPTINHIDTDLKLKVTVDDKMIIADLLGEKLDMSKLNMMAFLTKDSDLLATNVKIDIAKLKLKNNIYVDDLKFNMMCSKTKCIDALASAMIKNKPVKFLLLDDKNLEKWQLNCENAGDLLKGLGLYNNMKYGKLDLTVNTKRYDIKKGEIIPILDGTFNFKRFTTTDTPFLTRLVSFISFPGILTFITNNKEITFSNMDGKFSYINDILTISKTSAQGLFFDFTMKGKIDTKERRYQLTGNVVPSLFLMSKIVTRIPIIGYILSKAFPYSVNSKY